MVRKPTAVLTFLVWLASVHLIAQQQQTSQQPSQAPQTQQPSRDTSRVKREIPLYLVGVVAMEDGTPVSEPLRIEFVCDGDVRRQTYLDPQGNFTFEVGTKQPQSWMDAGVSGREKDVWGGDSSTPWRSASTMDAAGTSGLGRVNFNGCEIRAHPRAGYVSNLIVLGSRSVFDKPDVGTIVLRRVSPSSRSTISLGSLAAPPAARKALENAQKERAKNEPKTSKAIKELEKAVNLHPEFAAAWHLLGQTRTGLNDHDGARQAFLRAIEADENYLSPHLELARLELSQERWKETCGATERLLKLDPGHPQGRYFDGLANFALERYENAEESFRFLGENGHTQQSPQIQFYLGMICGRRGEIDAASRELRSYLETTPEQGVPQNLRELIHQQLTMWEQESRTRKANQSASMSSEPPPNQ